MEYQKQVIANAQALAGALMDAGFHVVSGGTDTHLMLVDVFSKGIRGKEAEAALDRARITVNKNAIPFDVNPPLNPSGIRLGSPAVTTRGFREPEMREVGSLIAEVLEAIPSEHAEEAVRRGAPQGRRRWPSGSPCTPGDARPSSRAPDRGPCPCASWSMSAACGTSASALTSTACCMPWPPSTSPTSTSWWRWHQEVQVGHGAFAGLPPNFSTVTYRQTDAEYLNHVAFPLFLHRLAPSLVHIPLNRVPLVHDASLTW